MRSALESLNMFMLDYLIVPIWAVFSAFGNMNSAKVMFFITLVFLIINYFSTRSTVRLFFLDMNLAAAGVAGIILNSFLYIRFVYADPQVVADMVTLIFSFTFFSILFCMLCLLVKSLVHRRNLRIISRMADGDYDTDDEEYDEDDEDDYEDEEDEDEDEDEDDEEDYDEDEEYEKRAGLIYSIKGLLKATREEDEEDEEEIETEVPEEEDDDSDRKSDESKFRVIKK